MSMKDDDRSPEQERSTVTPEVGDEGGSPGNVEVGVDRGTGTGSEAGETWRPVERGPGQVDKVDRVDDVDRVVRDETGEGRRSP